MNIPTKASNIKPLVLCLLIAGLIYVPFISPGVSAVSPIQKKERVLRHRKFPVEPLRILHARNKRQVIVVGRKFFEEDDWLKGLAISVKNTSEKNITFISLELHFVKKGAPEDEPIYAHQVFYDARDGTRELVAPGRIAELRLADEDVETIGQLLARDDYPSGATEVEVIVDEVQFSDGTFWRSGQFHERISKKKSQAAMLYVRIQPRDFHLVPVELTHPS